MKKRILSYMKYIDTLLSEDAEKRELDYEKLGREHLVQLGFFMHERQIHLLVTILFALMAFGTFFVLLIVENPSLVILFLLLLVLLIPYIMHYYLLENGCQYMYRQFDEMKKRAKEKTGESVFTLGDLEYRYLQQKIPKHIIGDE